MVVLRNLSVILIAVDMFLLVLVPLLVLGALVYGLAWLRRHENLPSWLKLAQAYTSLGQGYVDLAMAAIVRPFLFVHSTLAMVQRWLGVKVETGGDDQ